MILQRYLSKIKKFLLLYCKIPQNKIKLDYLKFKLINKLLDLKVEEKKPS